MTASDTVVTLDGGLLRCDGTVGGRLQYTMIPENPETGDENEHILRIVCEDAYGNRGEKTLTLRGEPHRKGQPAGWASIYIDMTVLGLGTTSAIRYEVLSGETASMPWRRRSGARRRRAVRDGSGEFWLAGLGEEL